MDTIIYFYQKREIREPEIDIRKETVKNIGADKRITPVIKTGIEADSGSGEYTLIRIGLNLKDESWFGQDMGQTVPEETQAILEAQEQALCETEEQETEEQALLFQRAPVSRRKGMIGTLRHLGRRKRQRKRQIEMQLQLEQALAEREERLKVTERQMRLAAERILKRVDREGECRYVCEDSLKKYAVWTAWLKCFPVKEFDGYQEEFWIRQLLPYAVHARFVILGVCDAMEGLIESCASRMRSVKWILKEREYTPALQDFVERFCEEYGLAITLQTVPGRTAYRKLRLNCPEPANILDFTDEAGIPVSEIAEGSVWLDMRPSEEKYRRIAGRGTAIQYFSLKERWRRGK